MKETATDLLNDALAMHRRGAISEAAGRYAEVLRVDPRNADALYYLAMMSCQEGRFAEGEKQARESLTCDPRHVRARVLLGRALAALGKTNDALASFDNAIADAPELAEAHGHRGDVLNELGRNAEAVESYDRALALVPGAAADWFNRGVALDALDRQDEAISSFDRAIATDPDFARAHLGRAKTLLTLERYDDAMQSTDAALAKEPNLADALLCRGVILNKLERREDAFEAYNRALALQPDLPEAWLGVGNHCSEIRKYNDAIAAYDKALAVRPDFAEAFLGRGNVRIKLKEPDAASADFDAAILLKPDLVNAWLGRGAALAALEQYDDAFAAYDKALALDPDMAEAWVGRANIFAARDDHDKAFAAYDRALALRPGLAGAWLGRGNVQYVLRHFDEALVAYDKAISLQPDLAEAWLSRGNVGQELSRLDEALAAYDRALALQPDLAEAWFRRGNILVGSKRLDDALAAIDRGLCLNPDSAEGWFTRGRALFEANRVTEALSAYDKALFIKADFAEALSNRIYALDFSAATGFAEQQAARDCWWREVGAPIAKKTRIAHRNVPDPDRRLKVGYLSSDFRRHSAARCFRPMLRNHDKTQFEITCYSASAVEDDFTEQFQGLADRWRNVAQLSDDEFCDLIQADQIDILVDLSGHTAGNRLTVFARKPAPVQVSAGATGTGIPRIDYLFSDAVACPPAVRHLFAEKVFDLPSIMTIEPLPYQIPLSNPPILSKGYVTFGVFNRVSKISNEAVSLWSRILEAVPQSRLLIKDTAVDEASIRARQLERFAVEAISPKRIAFLGATPHHDHLAAFKEVDISLDPFPQNGGISALESLQMGVPLVTLLGNGISSRAAGAILSSVGMDDWVAESTDGYLAIAAKFAAMPSRLEALRPELPKRVAQSAVGSGAIYTKALEAAYRIMWIEYCRTATGQGAASKQGMVYRPDGLA